MSYRCSQDKSKFRVIQTTIDGVVTKRRYKCPTCGTYIYTEERLTGAREAGTARPSNKQTLA